MRNPYTVFMIGIKKGVLNAHERLVYYFEVQLLIAIAAYVIDYAIHALQNQQNVLSLATWQVLLYYLPYLLFTSAVKVYSLYGPPGEATFLLDIGKQVFAGQPVITLPDAPTLEKETTT